MSDEEDPLNIGKVRPSKIKTISVTNVKIKSKPSPTSTPVDLFSVTNVSSPLYNSVAKRRKGFLKITSKVRSEFDIKKMTDPDLPISPSLPELSSFDAVSPSSSKTAHHVNKRKGDDEDFTAYFIDEKGDTSPSPALKQTRILLLNRTIDILNQIFDELKNQLNMFVLKKWESNQKYETILNVLQKTRRKGIEKNRKIAALHIIYHRKRGKAAQLGVMQTRENMERVNQFIDFLKNLKKEASKLLPAINVDQFKESLPALPKKCRKLEKIANKIQPHLQEIEETKPGTGDWYENLIHPDTKSGKIIGRFEDRINELNYDDVYAIVDHLSGGDQEKFSKIEQILFDLGWAKKPFPFGLKPRGKLPSSSDLFPAAIGQTLVPTEYAFTPFSLLNVMNWPFKSAVDMIFEMFIHTNPFSIARVFWDVIQEAAQCMQKVLVVEKGVRSEDVEIDFDSLFPILMICVFTFGSDEWMEIALYTISFNEHVSDDPQLQFSMTYLEGLVTHIMALDRKVLKKRGAELRNKWADEDDDPLGLK
ncbi:hypothetical protein TRFO_25200 [Tritrichomonas foetus]|uniref:VPS9 domain-containing protein n=1 Tax=Tritrichomonas foetus TaxID=1144522 RepID=A0A1J4KAH8_9EUKA|nr:hypothetical protein TRFO_25200 [Tritrichomonas foetus]|eukprot:OHT06670.1 hypothetical protein TRFO_25200 [Tritrichomonas foetus]